MSAPNVPYPSRSRSQRTYPARRQLNPWMVRLPLLIGTGLILLALALVILISGYEFLHRGEIYPGVSTIYDMNLAGMTREQAISMLSDRIKGMPEPVYVFRYGSQQWDYTASELGVTLDIEATVDAAYEAGRGSNWLANWFDQMDIRRNGYPVSPVMIYNQTEAERVLTGIARSIINRPTLDATLMIHNGKASTTPSQIGRTVDIPATLSVLRSQVLSMSAHSEISLVIHETQPLVWETENAAAQINLALSGPVEFYIPAGAENSDQGPWETPVSDLEAMLAVNQSGTDSGTAEYSVSINLDQVRAFLESLAPDLTTQPADARFIFNDDTHQLEVIRNSQAGRTLDIDGTLANFEKAVFATNPADRRVALIFEDVAPKIVDTMTASQLGITELVVKHTTTFYGSTSARRNNIDVAAANFHGLVIPPGEIFSFNEWLGDVSVESGYEQGLIIVGNQTITGVGGGVCQVATTAFQTAFYGGYPILERVGHAYRVSYYELGEGPGLDATVYSPIVDFRFLNDTPYYLLIETYVNEANSSITWKFYSTSTDRRVVKDGPHINSQTPPPSPIYRANANLAPGQVIQVDFAVSGADVTVYRTVYEGDRIVIDHEAFDTHYVPWASQYEVAPGDPRINSY